MSSGVARNYVYEGQTRAPEARGSKRRDGVWGSGEGCSPPSLLGDLGERRELPQWGPGQSPGRKRIFCIFYRPYSDVEPIDCVLFLQ